MKRPIAILIGLAVLASADAVLAQAGRGMGQGISGGGQTSGAFARTHAGPGQPGAHHGHHNGRPIVVVRPGWWWHHHHHGAASYSTVIVAAPLYYPVYTPVPVPVYVEQGSELRYYCPDYRDYYPNVATCPSQWMQVIPRAVGTTN